MSRYVIRNVLIMVFLLMLVSCAQGDFSPAPAAEAPAAPDAAQRQSLAAEPGYAFFFDFAEEAVEFDQEPQTRAERLIIQSATVHLESEYFDDVVDSLRNIPGMVGGYTQTENLSVHPRRQFEIVMRVPAAEFESVLGQIQAIADVRSMNISAEDVTDQFYDMASRLETRLIEEDRILELIDQTTRLSDLLELESRLASTRLQIERYRASLADMASRITYSTIRVVLVDVAQVYEPIAVASFGERIGGAFGSSVDGTIAVIQTIIVILAGAIIPLAIVSPVVVLLVLRRRKKTAVSMAESG